MAPTVLELLGLPVPAEMTGHARSLTRARAAARLERPGPAGGPLRALARDLLDLLLPPRLRRLRARRVAARRGALRGLRPRAAAHRRGRVSRSARSAAARRRARAARLRRAAGPLDACAAAVWFEGAAARWVKRFKYAAPGLAGLDPAAEAVALALVREARARVPRRPLRDALVPVPLHPARIRARAASSRPAVLAARAGARRSACRCSRGRLLRSCATRRARRARAARERRRNVAGCFACARPRALPASVWLVDDVVTTGATLGEAARALRRAGSRRVAAVCARAHARPRALKGRGRTATTPRP